MEDSGGATHKLNDLMDRALIQPGEMVVVVVAGALEVDDHAVVDHRRRRRRRRRRVRSDRLRGERRHLGNLHGKKVVAALSIFSLRASYKKIISGGQLGM